nr:serine/arginine repetitive matrix protein 2-like [Ipomoea batatas]
MSDSDSQNASAQDYDEGDEAISDSSSPSTGGSTFNQTDEAEHVSPLAEEKDGSTRPTASSEDVTAKISSEVYDYRIFRTPESYKSANLEPPDYGREEKYEPVPLAVPTTEGAIAEPSQGMSPERAFIAPAAAPRPKTKVALGAKKAANQPAADPPVVNVPDTTPIDSSSGGGAAPDLQVALGPSRRGKEKRQETEVEEVLTLKRTKRSANTRPAELHEGLRERDTLASTLVDQVRDKVPGLETIMGWSCNRLGEQIAEDILRLSHTTIDLFSRARALEGIREKEVVPLQKQVSAAERKIQELEKELAAAEDRAEKAEKKLGEAEARADKAEKAEQKAIDKMKDTSSLARFICTDEAIAKEFLTAFINTEVGDKLTWVYGQWAFSSGCQAIEEKVHTALVEGLEESDLPAVMALLPDKVADPGPRPYSKPGPSE